VSIFFWIAPAIAAHNPSNRPGQAARRRSDREQEIMEKRLRAERNEEALFGIKKAPLSS
jgi:hypothetical protein